MLPWAESFLVLKLMVIYVTAVFHPVCYVFGIRSCLNFFLATFFYVNAQICIILFDTADFVMESTMYHILHMFNVPITTDIVMKCVMEI
jgi:hypothetical protein